MKLLLDLLIWINKMKVLPVIGPIHKTGMCFYRDLLVEDSPLETNQTELL